VTPVIFTGQKEKLQVFAGKAGGNEDFHLWRGQDEGSPDLARITGPEGKTLAAQFYLGEWSDEEGFDIPALRIPELRDGILKLSPSVEGIFVYSNPRGICLRVEAAQATLETIGRDLALAASMLKAMGTQP